MIRRTTLIYLAHFFILAMVTDPKGLMAQNDAYPTNKYSKKKGPSPVISKTADLEAALRKGNMREIAHAYYALGEEYEKEGILTSSEENYTNSVRYFQLAGDDVKTADVQRRLARVQEKLNKVEDAAGNYYSASQNTKSKDQVMNTVNREDADRVMAKNKPAVQERKAMQKIEKLKSSQEAGTEIISESYEQVADAQVEQMKLEPAITNYREAMSNAANPDDKLEINEKRNQALIKANAIDTAIAVTRDLSEENEIATDPRLKIKAINQLSQLYTAKNDDKKVLSLLEESYRLAISTGQTYEARNLTQKLSELYAKKGDTKSSRSVFDRFAGDLEQVISADTSLMDREVMRLSSEKIRKLQEENELRDKLIKRQNTINFILLAGLLLLAATTFLIFRALSSIRQKNKVIALHSLRKEMNPHFIFNSLNSINQFISAHDERSANKYLTNFASLMRDVLDNSGSDFIALSVEKSLLTKYLELEHKRFSEKFDYEFNCDIDDADNKMLVPNMVIQPHIENAIWHGLRYRDSKGKLVVSMVKNRDKVEVMVMDNGIGRKASMEMKTGHQKQKKSRSTANITERTDLINDIYGIDIICHITDLESGSGTMVKLTFPADIKADIKNQNAGIK